jgi:hypothetical protein
MSQNSRAESDSASQYVTPSTYMSASVKYWKNRELPSTSRCASHLAKPYPTGTLPSGRTSKCCVVKAFILGHRHQIPILAGLTAKVVKAVHLLGVHKCVGQVNKELHILAIALKYFPLLARKGMEGQRAEIAARAGFKHSEVFHIP